MTDGTITAFVKERDAVLRSLDIARVQEFHRKHNPNAVPMKDAIAEIAMHKARMHCSSLTRDERKFSRDWLVDRGYTYAIVEPIDD